MTTTAPRSRQPKGVTTGGQFAAERRAESGLSLPVGSPASLAAEHLDRLPWPVPDLGKWQQDALRLPADFAEAFDAYFAQAHRLLQEHGNIQAATEVLDAQKSAALEQLSSAFPIKGATVRLGEPEQDWGLEGNGWYAQRNESGEVELTFCAHAWDSEDGGYFVEGGTITSDDPSVLQALESAQMAEATVSRMAELQSIEAGDVPVWSFLPPTPLQTSRADNVAQQYQGDRFRISREMADLNRTEWVDEYKGASEEDFMKIQRERFEQTKVTRAGGREITAWVDKADPLHRYYSDGDLEVYLQGKTNGYARALKERSGITSRREELEAERNAIEEKIRYYRQCAGWPGGDMSPQQRKDGSWAFYGRTAEGEWKFFDAPPKR